MTVDALPTWARLLIGYHLAFLAVAALLFTGASALDLVEAIRAKDGVPSGIVPTIFGAAVVFGLTGWGAIRLVRC